MIKEIISYDGKYPTLCGGTLKVILDNGEELKISDPCTSGGCICRSEDWDMWAEQGDWQIGYGLESNEILTPEDKQKVVDWFNANVPYGCCGGCI